MPHTSPSEFVVNAADMALVDVELVDAAVDRCPTACNFVNFSHVSLLTAQLSGVVGPAVGRLDKYVAATSLPVQVGIDRIFFRFSTMDGQVEFERQTCYLYRGRLTERRIMNQAPSRSGFTAVSCSWTDFCWC